MGVCVGAAVPARKTFCCCLILSFWLRALSAVTSVKTSSRPYTAVSTMRPGNRNACVIHMAMSAAATKSMNTQRTGCRKIASRPTTGSTMKKRISIS